MRRAIINIGLAVLVLVLGLGRTTQAEWITIQIEGVVDYVDDTGNYLEGKVNLGDTITGWYTYDTEILDTNPSTKVGDYWNYNSPAELYFKIEDLVFRSNPDSLNIVVEVVNDYPSGDGYVLGSYSNLNYSQGVPINMISWQLGDETGSALSSDALPTAPPDLDLWQFNHLRIESDRYFIISTHVVSASPEPATLILLTLGTLGLFSRNKSKY